MHSRLVVSLALGVTSVLGATVVHAQEDLASSPFTATLDPSTSRPVLVTPGWVEALEAEAGVPPCDGHAYWGRSTLDGGLASRRRPEGLPCRSVWDSQIRFELGLSGGGLLERGDGAIGAFTLQLGVRYHELVSVYYQGQILGGGWARGGGNTIDVASWHGAMLEISPHQAFAVAAGPTFDITAGCDMNVDQSSGCWYAWSYGVSSRVTLSLAQVDSTGITLTGDFHVSLIEPDPRATVLVGLGFRL